MREPLRLRDDPSASDDVRDLLRAFPGPKGSSSRRGEPASGLRPSGARPLTPAERRRVAQRVMVIATLPVAAGSLMGLKGLALAAVIGVGGAVGVRAGTEVLWRADSAGGAAAVVDAPSHAEAPPALRDSHAPEVARSVEPDEADLAPDTVPAPVALPETISQPRDSDLAAPAAPSDTLLEEVSLLEEARALVGSNPNGALAKIEAHRARFPGGKLGIERELIAVDALGRAGRGSEARARGEALLARTEGSLYEERVRAILASLP